MIFCYLLQKIKQYSRLCLVSFEVFKRSPQPLKVGIVTTTAFNKFLETVCAWESGCLEHMIQ